MHSLLLLFLLKACFLLFESLPIYADSVSGSWIPSRFCFRLLLFGLFLVKRLGCSIECCIVCCLMVTTALKPSANFCTPTCSSWATTGISVFVRVAAAITSLNFLKGIGILRPSNIITYSWGFSFLFIVEELIGLTHHHTFRVSHLLLGCLRFVALSEEVPVDLDRFYIDRHDHVGMIDLALLDVPSQVLLLLQFDLFFTGLLFLSLFLLTLR